MTSRIVPDMPETPYHAEKALSASGAFTLAAACPALYWHTSPFNPDAVASENGKEMDIGTALHLAVLEPDRLADRTLLVDAKDWRTKAAQEARDQAYEAGVTPLLPKDRELVDGLSAALRANEYVAALLEGASTEVSYFWTDEGIPRKARADIVTHDGGAIADLKASASAAPEFFQRQAFSAGPFLRSPWYRSGWEIVSGQKADYWYVVISRKPPHLVTIARLDERAIAWGEMMIRRATELFKRCRDDGSWPPYCIEPATLSLPGWAEYQLADREQAGDFSPITAADARRSLEWME